MADTTNFGENTLNLLKTWYDAHPESLIVRDSPALKKVKAVRVEGKQQGLATLVGASSASADYEKSVEMAATSANTAEFLITPGRVFASWLITPAEELASKTDKGAYMPVAAWKAFASTAGFRKILANSLYNDGYGVIDNVPTGTAFVTTGTVTFNVSRSALFSIDNNFKLEVVSSKTSSTALATLTVKKVDLANKAITVESDTAYTSLAGDMIRYQGSVMSDASGNVLPALPIGLKAWCPTSNDRVYVAGNDWANAIDNKFFNVTRNIAPDRLAGGFYKAASGESKKDTILTSILTARAAGSKADMILMNDEDYRDLVKETQLTNFVATEKKNKNVINNGVSEFTAALSSNYIENIIDDPFCPKGTFYVLDSEEFQLWVYSNAEKKNGSIVAGEPGREEPLDSDGSEAKSPYQLLIDDCLTVQPGPRKPEGPTSVITLQLYGSFVPRNTADVVVGLFA